MRINLSSAVLLLNLMQVLAIVKETISYDAKGQVIRKVIAHESEVTKCWRYTWLGAETESTNLTSGCMDLETEDEPKRPCFPPLVWTYNDENGSNEPDLGELESTCQEKGCVPFCTPGPSQTCVKYSEWTGKQLSYTSQFCGSVTLEWSGSKSSINRCFRAGAQEYCFCDQYMQTLCNSAPSLQISLVFFVIILLMAIYVI